MSKAKFFFVAIAMFMIAFAMGLSSAWAQEEPAPGGTDNPQSASSVVVDDGVVFNHTLNASAAVNMTGIAYRVNITAHDIGTSPDTGEYAVPAAVTTAMAGISPTTFSPDGDSAAEGSTEWTRTYNSTKTFEQVFGPASNFGHAGVYPFDVTETVSGGSSSDASKWAWTSATGSKAPEQYIVRVYVINGNSGLEYSSITISKLDDNAAGLPNDAKVGSLDFSSRYIATQTLTISKQVEGTFGDQEHAFPFEIALILPSWVDGAPAQNIAAAVENEEKAQITTVPTEWAVVTDGHPIGGAIGQMDGGAISRCAVYEATLSHGGSISFTVPVGTRYGISETAPSAAGIDYDVDMDWNVGIITQQVDKIDGQNGSFVVGSSPTATSDSGLSAGETSYVVTTPDPGYELASVTVQGATSGSNIPTTGTGNIRSFIMPSENVTVTPVFVKSDLQITNTNNPAGDHGRAAIVIISEDSGVPEGYAHVGDEIRILVTPDGGYELSSVGVIGAMSGGDVPVAFHDNTAVFSMPGEPVTINTVFEKSDLPITNTNNPSTDHGSIAVLISSESPDVAEGCAQVGDEVEIVATPDTGYELGSITVTGDSSRNAVSTETTSSGVRFAMPSEPVTVAAAFSKADYALSQASSPSNGTFSFSSSSSGLPVITTAQYGDTVYIVASPTTGYRLSGVTVNEGHVDATIDGNTASFTMPAEPVDAAVTFTEATYSIMNPLSVTGGTYAIGTSPFPTSTITQAQYGETVYLSAVPNTGFEASVIMRGTTDTTLTLDSNHRASFAMPAENITILVTFEKIDYTISTSATTNGTFVVGTTSSATMNATTAHYGDMLYIVATPENNYRIETMAVEESTSGTSIPVTQPVGSNDEVGSFTMPANNVTVSVSFKNRQTDGNASAVLLSSAQTISGHNYAEGTLVMCRIENRSTTPNSGYVEEETVTDIYGNRYTGYVYDGIETRKPSLSLLGTSYSSSSQWDSKKTTIVAVDIADNTIIAPQTTSNWFQGCSNLATCDLDGLDTSNVLDMSGMFSGCRHNSFTAPNMSNWDTSEVLSMAKMFNNCQGAAFSIPDISGWNTAKVQYMNSMFSYCQGASFVMPDISGWNTSSVKKMDSMFEYCDSNAFIPPNMSRWNTENLESAKMMFYSCSGTGCTTINIAGWNITKLTDTSRMFSNCSNLRTIYAATNDNWSASATLTTHTDMFYGCSNLKGGNRTAYNSSKTDKEYARIDRSGQIGYFTVKPA